MDFKRKSAGQRRWPAFDARAVIVAIALTAATYIAFSAALFNDGDTGWHLAAGEWILRHHAVPHVDPFSFTARGRPWTAHEWLAELIMGLAFKGGGWSALALLFAIAFGATLWLIGRPLARALPLRYALLALAIIIAILAPAVLARPHLLAWPLLALWIALLVRARKRRRAPPLAAALLMTIWANLHASYIIGLAMAAAFALEALVEEPDRRRATSRWCLFGLAALACAFITPHGLQGFLYPFQVSSMKSLPLIEEWRAMRLPDDLAFVALALATAVLAVARWRRIGIVRVLMVAVLVILGAMHARHQPVFAIFAAIAFIPKAFAVPARPAPAGRPLAALAALAVLACAIRLIVPIEQPDAPNWPLDALQSVGPERRSQPVLNSYSFGGPMALVGIAPFIDGRADMYGDELNFTHQRLMEGDMAALATATKRWHLRWAILNPNEPLVSRLDRSPGWRRAYADDRAVIFVRGGTSRAVRKSAARQAGRT